MEENARVREGKPPGGRRPDFWQWWLLALTAAVVLSGLGMVLAPGPTRRLFSLLLFSSADHIDAFGRPAAAYASLAHGVLGAVLAGWGTALLFLLGGPFRRGSAEAWWTLAVSLAAWLVPDTLFSLASGSWRNAALNGVLAVLFAVPLAATRPGTRIRTYNKTSFATKVTKNTKLKPFDS